MRTSSHRMLVLLCAAMGTTACTTHKATINSFADPTYEPQLVRRLAVFPIRNARAAPSEAQTMNRRIGQGVAGRSPGVEMVHAGDAVRLINEHGLADTWARFYEGYVIGGIPDADALQTVGLALGVDAILQGEVVNVFQQDGSFGANRGQTRVTVRFSLLDTTEGVLIWEATSDGLRQTSTTLGGAPPLIEAINLAVDRLISSMPRMGGAGGGCLIDGAWKARDCPPR